MPMMNACYYTIMNLTIPLRLHNNEFSNNRAMAVRAKLLISHCIAVIQLNRQHFRKSYRCILIITQWTFAQGFVNFSSLAICGSHSDRLQIYLSKHIFGVPVNPELTKILPIEVSHFFPETRCSNNKWNSSSFNHTMYIIYVEWVYIESCCIHNRKTAPTPQ